MHKDPHRRRGLGPERRDTVDAVLARRQPDLTVLADRLPGRGETVLGGELCQAGLMRDVTRQEGFKPGQKGSSAMPHKRNPILTENLTGLARLMRSWLCTSCTPGTSSASSSAKNFS